MCAFFPCPSLNGTHSRMTHPPFWRRKTFGSCLPRLIVYITHNKQCLRLWHPQQAPLLRLPLKERLSAGSTWRQRTVPQIQ